ncbi:OmpA family protein [Parasulfuritortus cantonensis]|uniref:OmpA family protein n=1 Tax=Parasulfuritortus cantonensis TaxID=2528202 RepID=A0A4R1BRL2_9PROT|nr:OmpA family protein [Parasulfuritortus cantonensis]TCJ20419.1 OmpA family protein [Parasulfuritortus cantonensis]
MHLPLYTALTAALLAAGMTGAQAAGPYYDPSNAASPTKYTTDYELYRTIGCPGKQLLDAACKIMTPAAAPAPAAPAPVAAAPAAPVDSDKDGVTDDKDQCPNTPAGRKVDAKGCELDSDGDGVVDGLDKCPDTPAGRKVDTRGCELDSDGDGVVDGLDQCPNTPAGRKVDAKGCELDSDGDGVVDGLDQCPNTPAGDKVDNKGCTLLNTIVLKGVNFDNDSAKLRTDAFPILDDAVTTMKRYPTMKVEVAGHTDSNSSDAYNLKLSDRRAKAVMDYFVSHGVDAANLTSKGYGESEPIADNKTAAGRAENRRVELRIQ